MSPDRRRAASLLCLLVVACADAADPDARVAADSAPPAVVDDAAAAAPDSAALKACDLASESELEDILGLELEPARTTNDYAGVSQCRWDLPGDAQRGVSISFYERGEIEKYRRVPGSANVPGLGDAAVWNPDVGQLAVLRGARLVSVGLLVERPQRGDAERIARIALGRL